MLVADAADAVMAEGFLADAVARYGTRLHTSHADQGGVSAASERGSVSGCVINETALRTRRKGLL
ncbi:hypothetical protein ACFFSW_00815 [Saccharothrix longispora]|uniref:Uncharacterized protein n=1 Tax=Saccharothrix longispora TaxID=33920 RepID=A0ABU1PXA3_9PSEU|nr:hypothetical protein [Saccharothrix longispora]MDR6594524.1 hypothetical protein [Saccharothrix longispora]